MQPAPYPPSEILLQIADGEYLFKLKARQVAELQEKCRAGIATIHSRVFRGEWYREDLTETIRLGLIGGNRGVVDGEEKTVSAIAAKSIMDRYIEDQPLEFLWVHAMAILGACIQGYSPPDKGAGGEAPKGEAATDGSTSPLASEIAPSSDSDPQKPAT